MPSERAPQEEQNSADFSIIAPSSEELRVDLYTESMCVVKVVRALDILRKVRK